MEGRLHARLLNADGELIAEGLCSLDDEERVATLQPERAPGVLQKERGALSLVLETGRSLRVSDRPIITRLGPPTNRTIYRLRLIEPAEAAQEATVAGATGDGTPAGSERRAPAAR